jgi:hypothetical protein
MFGRFAISVLASTAFAFPAMAQMRVASTPMPGGSTSVHAITRRPPVIIKNGTGVSVQSGLRFHHHRGFGNGFLYPYPYFYPYDDYDEEPEIAQAAPPQVIVVPTAQPAQAQPPAAPPEPLLIEWQGDHFVRMTLAEKNREHGAPPDFSEKTAPPALQKTPAQAPRELPPATLVFRDGHQEQVNSYTIVKNTIYTKSDYWASGSWGKKIQTSDLDIPATLKTNQERGVNFSLPTSPNEVVVRP